MTHCSRRGCRSAADPLDPEGECRQHARVRDPDDPLGGDRPEPDEVAP